MHPSRTLAAARPSLRPVLLAGLVALLVLLPAAVAPATARASSSGVFSAASETELIALTNQARKAAGLAPLRADAALTAVARWRSRDMGDHAYFSHTIPSTGTYVFATLTARSYCYKRAGENIGWDTFPDGTATAAVQKMFLASPSHRANILARAWTKIGVGAYEAADGKKLWTVLFATPCTRPAVTGSR